MQPQIFTVGERQLYFSELQLTRTLEMLYEIPKKRILHIHGCAQNSEGLIFGHNTIAVGDGRTFDEGEGM